MDIAQCIGVFRSLCGEIFAEKNTLRFLGQARHDHKKNSKNSSRN
jgi:hypothetical protein